MTRPKTFVAALRLAVLPAIVLTAVVVAWKLGYFELDRRQRLLETVQRLRVLPGVEGGFVAAYTVVIALCLPASVANVLGGAIFGPWIGALLSWSGGMVATGVAHALARTVAKAPLRKLFGEHRLLKRMKDNDSVTELLRLRVIPIAPLAVMSYVAGIADVSLRRLLLATALGTLPGVVAYSFVGSALMSALLSPDDASRGALWIAGSVTVVMLVLAVVPRIVRKLRL